MGKEALVLDLWIRTRLVKAKLGMIKAPLSISRTPVVGWPLLLRSAFLPIVIVLIGLFLRFRLFLLNDSLWLDEACLALNILSRSFQELTLPLDYGQATPILLLFLMKIATLSLGNSELALRAVPLLAGVITLIIFHYCAKEILGKAGSLVSVSLLALSPQLISRSTEVHQYSTDVLASVIITYLGFRLIRAPSKSVLIFAIFIPTVLIWLSHPSVFVLFPVGCVALCNATLNKDRVQFLYLVVAVIFWLASFGIVYLQSLEEIGDRQYFIDGWGRRADAFMPWGWRTGSWLYSKITQLSALPLIAPAVIILPLTIAGFFLLFHRDWRQAVIVLGPILVTMIVSSAKLYPFADRLIIFLIPQIILLVATAIEGLTAVKWRYIGSLLSSLAVAVLLYQPVHWNLALIVFPENFGRENFRDVFKTVESSDKCKDYVFIHEAAYYHYKYYHDYRGFDLDSEVRIVSRTTISNVTNGIPKCIWIVYAHISESEINYITTLLNDSNYDVLNRINKIGASALLYAQHP